MNVFTLRKKKSGAAGFLVAAALILLAGTLHAEVVPPAAAAGPQTVNGIVVDSDGGPVAGAVVRVFSSAGETAVVTGTDGVFSFTAPAGARIEVSFLGYQTHKADIGGRSELTIVLEEENREIEKVVVVAYGTQRKVTVTGAISSVQSDELRQSSSANLGNALAGKVAGLSSLQSSGQPGKDDANLYVRGVVSVNGSRPLILVDGVERDNLSALDVNEVASVSVLKDASSTAVFGVRGAQGVILITTRRGREGPADFSLNWETSLHSFTRTPERIHSWEYMEMRNQALTNRGEAAEFLPEQIALYTNPDKTDLEAYMYPDHDYYGESIRQFTPQTRVNMNISGGSKRFQYFVNAAYLNQGGQFKTESPDKLGYNPQTRLNRYSFRSNIDFTIHKNLKAFLNLGSYVERVGMPGSSVSGVTFNNSITEAMYLLNSTLPITPGPTTIAGHGAPEDEVVVADYLPERSGFMIINRVGARKETRLSFQGSLGVDWDLSPLIRGLSTKLMVSFDTRADNATVTTLRPRKYNVKVDNGELMFPGIYSEKNPVTLSKGASSSYVVNIQYSLNYDRTFNDAHKVTAMVLLQRNQNEIAGGSSVALMPYNVLGLSARATYSFRNRYLVELNAGYNGSEQFAPKNRFGFFPAASVGWVASNEPFLSGPLKKAAIDFLKLRVSYGKVGNDRMGNDRFLYLDQMEILTSLGTGGPFYGEEPIPSLGRGRYVLENRLGNPDMQWEVVTKMNVGLDLVLFKDLNITFDYFWGDSDKMLISRQTTPMIQGVKPSLLPKSNMGTMKFSGYEIELAYEKAISPGLSVNARGTFSYNNNRITYFDEVLLPEDYAYRYRTTGYVYGQQWGYQIDYSNGNGMFNSQDEIDGYFDSHGNTIRYSMGTPSPGDFIYKDLNDDGVIDEKDQAPVGGSSIPKITYGISLGVNFRQFDLSVFLQGVGARYSYYAGYNVWELGLRGAYLDYHKRAWTEDRYLAGEKIEYPALGFIETVNHQPNDFFIMNRSFIRLKEVVLGYSVPRKALSKIGISNIRVYVSGQNLFTFDKLPTRSFDPEQDYQGSYPITRLISIGANISF